jgi:hypothetical protein
MAERTQRMRAVWAADSTNAFVLSRAKARFRARLLAQKNFGLPRSPWRGPLALALVGAIASIAALAVRSVEGKGLGADSAHDALEPAQKPASATANAPAAATPTAYAETPRGKVRLTNGGRLQLGAGESARLAFADGSSSTLVGPCSVVFWSSLVDVGGWRLSHEEPVGSAPLKLDGDDAPAPLSSTPRAAPAPAARSAPQRTKSSSTERLSSATSTNPGYAVAWARAAEALQRGDFQAADGAFAELAHAQSSTTRDAAELARAQLWILHGRAAAVKPVLERLATVGSTPLVRKRAAECLAREYH